jgi:hypothetical protein
MKTDFVITSEQVRAARALIRWEQRNLAETSKVSLPSIKRLETTPGALSAQPRVHERRSPWGEAEEEKLGHRQIRISLLCWGRPN